MSPKIEHGELIVVKPGAPVIPGKSVVIALKNGRKMVKKLIFLQHDSVSVESVNDGDRITVELTDVQYIHPVQGICASDEFPDDPGWEVSHG